MQEEQIQGEESIFDLLMNKPVADDMPIFKINKLEKPSLDDPDIEEDDIDMSKLREVAVIIDKTSESKIDRDKILQELKGYQELVPYRQQPKEIDLEEETLRDQTVLDPVKPMPLETIEPSIRRDGDIQKEPSQYKLERSPEETQLEKVVIKPNTVNIPEIEKAASSRKQISTISSLRPAEVDVPEDIYVNAPVHYLDNREMFIRSLNLKLKKDFKFADQDEESVISCDSKSDERFALLSHQKIVKYYLNIFTPYRGLLLYHGLGAGKTCASIAIAEGLKTHRKILIMTPASLRMNYIEELKKCGDPLYKRNQHWEFISTVTASEYLPLLKSEIGLSDDYIKKNKGGWLVNPKKPSNYDTLSTQEKSSLDRQINDMIGTKYDFINYNGVRNLQYDQYREQSPDKNPFTNRVVIVDEAHNLVSKIVNKLKMSAAKRKTQLSFKMYEDLMSAQNCKIVLLSGTPMINYPNEIGILFNILRGYIKTWSIPLVYDGKDQLNTAKIRTFLKDNPNANYINYNANTKVLELTRNPYGFINNYSSDKYNGVVLNERGEVNDKDFINNVRAVLKPHKIKFDLRSSSFKNNKALPDDIEEFKNMFFNLSENKLKNSNILIKRILGLTSYFRSAQEQLMPAYDESKDLIVELIEMSDYQFTVYNKARAIERKEESAAARKKKAGKDIYESISSTYRIFSRLFCNFVFPDGIDRPMPNKANSIEDTVKTGIDETLIDNLQGSDLIEQSDAGMTKDDAIDVEKEKGEKTDGTYEMRIISALDSLKKMGDAVFSQEVLVNYSPKFLKIIQNIMDEGKQGKHLLYTQFRSLEGIAIIKLILEYYGFVQFKIKKNSTSGSWELDVPEAAQSMPMFALYTGTESAEEKEIIRNVFNDQWKFVPQKLREQISLIQPENTMGQLIKLLMITSSGAEGISLTNVRYVHITEPYWHPVRREQVIGRAKRICSHNTLPPELRTVNVHLYLMTFSEKQLSETEQSAVELKLKDRSMDGKEVFTTDQSLHELSNVKQELSNQLLKAIKQAAIDCDFHKNKGVVCYKFSNPSPDKFSFVPKHENEENEEQQEMNIKEANFVPQEFVMPGTDTKYIRDVETNRIYSYKEYTEYKKANGAMALPDPIGLMKLKKGKGGKDVVDFEWY